MSQMAAVSPAFAAALQGSFEYRVAVDVWADGRLVTIDGPLDVTSGSLSITDGQAVRSAVSLTVADPDGLIRPTGDDSSITPYGPELNIRAGIRLGARVELVSLGWFPITSVKVDQRWRTYQSATDTIRVPSGTVQIEAVDRAQWIAEARFEAREQPRSATVLGECARILAGVAPWQAPAGITDRGIPSTITYDDDRLGALVKLADALNADPVADPSGSITLVDRTWGAPVWTVAGGDDGVLASWQRQMTRDGVYNAAVVSGADPDNGLAPKMGRARQADGPLRYRPGFRIPYFQASPILTTQSQVDKAATTTLARVVSQRTQTVDVECSPNPAITAGDILTLQAPRGTVPVKVAAMKLPLTPGRMQISCQADPVLLGLVA